LALTSPDLPRKLSSPWRLRISATPESFFTVVRRLFYTQILMASHFGSTSTTNILFPRSTPFGSHHISPSWCKHPVRC
jgi:hypothetical protein